MNYVPKDQPMKNKILDILRTEARISNEEIARRLGASVEQVAEEIGKLERGKTVLGYRAIINPEKLDDEPCLGIIELKLTPQRNVGYDEIAAQIYKYPRGQDLLPHLGRLRRAGFYRRPQPERGRHVRHQPARDD